MGLIATRCAPNNSSLPSNWWITFYCCRSKLNHATLIFLGVGKLVSRLAAAPTRRFDFAVWDATRLMDYSEYRVELAAQGGVTEEMWAAARILESLPLYRTWEQTHGRWMQGISSARQPQARIIELRRFTFQAIHRKAPFEYMRDRHVTGSTRRRLIRLLFGTDMYATCVVREHAAFLCSSCSLLCMDSMYGELLHDEAYCELLAEYELAYTDYYRTYCDTLLEPNRECADATQALLPYLRYQLKSLRDRMLGDRAATDDFRRLRLLYAATGDTQRLPALL
jgi:hypothetical protein